jgi:hypothetical protein
MSRITLEGKHSGETRSQIFDFISRLALAETISTATTTAAVYSGTDASPSSVISGSASISGTQVTQKLTAGTAGVVYLLTCTITTSAGQVLTLNAFLPITPAQN